ncbi:peroxiredoxin [Paracidobacterium acidisoli]|uniref:thioredoxin-dependent peroxiredoxin n=1 Tax=Paracidobacterium acidisoli TaxID=2303751 RepID=A0A372IQE2_9BACT|nr:peroxiredoxin [Paracidobacterium acidisoli]MBT9331464.1 peroxiredoxin [Paracidobacterium acidisoli]
MSRTSVLTLAAVVVAAVLGFATLRSFAADDASMPQIGQNAPNFTLPSEENTPVSLHTYRGKWVVLYFYPKDMTQGCTIEAHNFQRDMDKYHADNAIVLGVSVDSVDSHKEFCAKDGLGFTLLSDSTKKVVAEYGSLNGVYGMANRNTFLINPHGKIVKVWTKVNPSVHSEEVLTALADFQKKG